MLRVFGDHMMANNGPSLSSSKRLPDSNMPSKDLSFKPINTPVLAPTTLIDNYGNEVST